MTSLSAPAELAARLVDATVHTLELYAVYLGRRLGLYAALREHGPLSAAGLSACANIHPRYAQEWLEQQAVAGLLATDSSAGDDRIFSLSAPGAAVLVDAEDPDHVSPLAEMVVGIGRVLPEVARAYRTGDGVPFARFGPEMRHGQGAINRPAFSRDLVQQWLPAMPDLHARLLQGPCRIADVGCGQGWSTVALAATYPQAKVVGFDLDEASVADARRNAAKRGVDVAFECRDAAALDGSAGFDLIVILEALHDTARPQEVLAALRQRLNDGGSIVVAEENVSPTFEAPGRQLDRLMYGWSVSHCLPAAMADASANPTGTVLRPDTLQRLAADAGLERFEELPGDFGFFRLYRLRAANH